MIHQVHLALYTTCVYFEVYVELHPRNRLARNKLASVPFLFFVGTWVGHFQEVVFGAAAAAAACSEEIGNRGPRAMLFASHLSRALSYGHIYCCCCEGVVPHLFTFYFFCYEHIYYVGG